MQQTNFTPVLVLTVKDLVFICYSKHVSYYACLKQQLCYGESGISNGFWLSLSECYVFIFNLPYNILLPRAKNRATNKLSLVFNSSLYYENIAVLTAACDQAEIRTCLYYFLFLFLCDKQVFFGFTSNKAYFLYFVHHCMRLLPFLRSFNIMSGDA